MRSYSVAEYEFILQMKKQVAERLSAPGLFSLESVSESATGPVWTGMSDYLSPTVQQG